MLNLTLVLKHQKLIGTVHIKYVRRFIPTMVYTVGILKYLIDDYII